MTLPDFDSASTYGALNKVNYQALPPSDPTTDWDNTLLAPSICNIAGITQTLPRAAVQITLNPSDGYIVVNNWDAVWGNITTTAPVIYHVSTGLYAIVWPSVVSDEYNASLGIFNNHSVNFTKGLANIENPGGLASAHVSASANILEVTLYDHTNALNDFSGKILDVFGCY